MAKHKCSFCDKESNTLKKLPSGEMICDRCAAIANVDISLLESVEMPESVKPIKPIDMKNYLDQYVIGQERAKKSLSVAVYNHYKRIEDKDENIPIKKSNIIMIGPSGTGKTLLLDTMAKKLGVPFAIYDATSLTSAGYVGDDVENILARLLQSANNDIEKAEIGIVYIDEIDKIAKRGDSYTMSKDVSGECVQQSLLKIIESSKVDVPVNSKKKGMGDTVSIDTSNILFVVGGAFSGIDQIVKARLKKSSNATTIGFSSQPAVEKAKEATKSELYAQIKTEDLIRFGMIPEFLGRLPVIVTLSELDREAMKEILLKPKDSIVKQYQRLLGIDGIELEFNEESLDAIADKAMSNSTGARSLRSIIEDAMLDIMFALPSMDNVKKCIVTKATIMDGEFPIVEEEQVG